MHAYQKKILASSMLGLALESMDVMLLSFALSSIISEFHLSAAVGGMLPAITNLGVLAGGVIFGYLADRYGRIKTFTYTIIIFALATLFTVFAQNMVTIYWLRFAVGLGAGGEYGIGMALVAESFPLYKRGRMSAWVTIGGQLGTLLAAIIAALILPRAGWRAIFIFGFIPVILAYFVRRHLPETQAWQKVHQRSKTQQKSVTPITALINTPKKFGLTLGLTMMAAIQVAGYFGLMNWLPTVFERRLNLSVSQSSVWMISIIVGMSLGMFCFGKLLDYLGPKVTFSCFLIFSIVAVLLYTFVSNALSMLVVGAVVGFFTNGMHAGYGALISSFYPTEIRSFANNVIFNTGRAVGGLSPILIGYLIDLKGFSSALFALGAMYLVSLIIVNLIPNPFQTQTQTVAVKKV